MCQICCIYLYIHKKKKYFIQNIQNCGLSQISKTNSFQSCLIN